MPSSQPHLWNDVSEPDAGEDVSDGSGKGHDNLVNHLKNRIANYDFTTSI